MPLPKHFFAGFALTALLVAAPLAAEARNPLADDFVPNDCSGHEYDEPGYREICENARTFRTPIKRTTMAIGAIIMQMAGELCGWELKDPETVERGRQLLVNSQEMREFEAFYRGHVLEVYNSGPEAFCREALSMRDSYK